VFEEKGVKTYCSEIRHGAFETHSSACEKERGSRRNPPVSNDQYKSMLKRRGGKKGNGEPRNGSIDVTNMLGLKKNSDHYCNRSRGRHWGGGIRKKGHKKKRGTAKGERVR